MTDELHDMSVMAASERLMELIQQRDDQEALREREDRLWELGDTGIPVPAPTYLIPLPEEPDD